MKPLTKYQAEDGRTFDTAADCKAHELAHGYTGPIAEHLDSLSLDPGQGRSLRRNAISAFLRWHEKENTTMEQVALDDDEAADRRQAARRVGASLGVSRRDTAGTAGRGDVRHGLARQAAARQHKAGMEFAS